jgi:hypothetical protein
MAELEEAWEKFSAGGTLFDFFQGGNDPEAVFQKTSSNSKNTENQSGSKNTENQSEHSNSNVPTLITDKFPRFVASPQLVSPVSVESREAVPILKSFCQGLDKEMHNLFSTCASFFREFAVSGDATPTAHPVVNPRVSDLLYGRPWIGTDLNPSRNRSGERSGESEEKRDAKSDEKSRESRICRTLEVAEDKGNSDKADVGQKNVDTASPSSPKHDSSTYPLSSLTPFSACEAERKDLNQSEKKMKKLFTGEGPRPALNKPFVPAEGKKPPLLKTLVDFMLLGKVANSKVAHYHLHLLLYHSLFALHHHHHFHHQPLSQQQQQQQQQP